MKKILFLLVCLSCFFSANAQKDKEKILQILKDQVTCWNEGNLECFMEGYWKSESLMFIGKSGLEHGWQSTLNNYKKSYPDKTTMGKLSFDIQKVEKLSKDSYFVVGKWQLEREIGDVNGYFSLIWKIINGRWVITSDHSS
jgi:hypothetical protein